jgi:hypothetical protein
MFLVVPFYEQLKQVKKSERANSGFANWERRRTMLEKMPGMGKGVTDAAGEAVKKASELAGSAAELAERALEQFNQLAEDFSEVLSTMNALGLSIELMTMQVSLKPEVQLKITGALDAIDENKIKELITAKAQNKVLSPILQAFRTLALLKKPLGAAGFKGVRVDLTAGIVPEIKMEFLR